MLTALKTRMRQCTPGPHHNAEGRWEVDDSWRASHPNWYSELTAFRSQNSDTSMNKGLHTFATNFLAQFCVDHRLKDVTGLTYRYVLANYSDVNEEDRTGSRHSDLDVVASGVIAAYIVVEGGDVAVEGFDPEREHPSSCKVMWKPYNNDRKHADYRKKFELNLNDGWGYYTDDDVGEMYTHQTKVGESVTKKWALLIGTVSKKKRDDISFDARKIRFGTELHWHRDAEDRVVSGVGAVDKERKQQRSLHVCTPSY